MSGSGSNRRSSDGELFRPFIDASYDAAERAALELKGDVQRVLNDNAIDDSSGPVRVIHAVLEGWDGPPGSVAYKFKFDYLANLQKALRYQLEFAQALELILAARAALIRFSCEQVLDIANKTVALLERADADQRQASQDATLTIVDKIVGYAEAAEGGPVKVATVALKELTESFREQLADPAGETPWEITESMERAVSELHKLVTVMGQLYNRSNWAGTEPTATASGPGSSSPKKSTASTLTTILA